MATNNDLVFCQDCGIEGFDFPRVPDSTDGYMDLCPTCYTRETGLKAD